MHRCRTVENGAVAALAFLKAARCRLAFLQQSLLNLDAGDGVLEGAAGVADDASIAVLEAMQALEQDAFSLPKRSRAAEPEALRMGAEHPAETLCGTGSPAL